MRPKEENIFDSALTPIFISIFEWKHSICYQILLIYEENIAI